MHAPASLIDELEVRLKSGTNDIHGSAFWDRHTDAFDARNGFASTVTPFRLNQFGASGGFPIKKDKAFFFVSYDGQPAHTGRNQPATAPTQFCQPATVRAASSRPM